MLKRKNIKIKLSNAAKDDLLQIWSFIADDNVGAADNIIYQFYKIFERLRENPHLGKDRPELSSSLKSFPLKKYVIFYFNDFSEKDLVIVRVLHSARDIENQFSE